MHNTLKDIMISVLSKHDKWLYNAALTKFIYLVDVESVRRYERQITEIIWFRNNFGPFVWDVHNCAKEFPDIFDIQAVVEKGMEKRRIVLKDYFEFDTTILAESIICDVIKKSPNPKTNFLEFKDVVYSTPPMLLSKGNGVLNMKKSIIAAKEVDNLFDSYLNTPEWQEAFEYLAMN